MASSAHPSFPSRQYGTSLGKLPERPIGTAFGATTQQRREAERMEREREREERERREREEQIQISEEHKEEIKEAVSPPTRSKMKMRID